MLQGGPCQRVQGEAISRSRSVFLGQVPLILWAANGVGDEPGAPTPVAREGGEAGQRVTSLHCLPAAGRGVCRWGRVGQNLELGVWAGLWSQANVGASPGPRALPVPVRRSHQFNKSWPSGCRTETVTVSNSRGWATCAALSFVLPWPAPHRWSGVRPSCLWGVPISHPSTEEVPGLPAAGRGPDLVLGQRWD